MTSETLHLFHVDDDEDDRFFLGRAVRASALPIVVTNAASGDEALQRLRGSQTLPDMLLLDIRMPGMSGFEFLEAFKRTVQESVPVVMYSNSNQDVDIERARELGARAYCVKPSGLDQLVEFVKRPYHSWRRKELPCEWPKETSV